MDPVPLTNEQINSILQDVPNPPGIGKRAIKIARYYQHKNLRDVLKEIKLIPDEEVFGIFKEEIIKSYYQSLAEPGLNVGVEAGVALGGPITQMSLNTFHFAGAQSGVALAFQRVRDFLTGSKMNRTPQMKIYFKEFGTGNDLHDVVHVGDFDSILSKRPEFEQTTVKNCVLDHEILARDEAEVAGVPDLLKLHAKLRPHRFTNIQEQFPLTQIIQLNLNTYRMYTHRITMTQLCRAIEGPEPADLITCVWRSQLDGKMYIIVDETQDLSRDLNREGIQDINPASAVLMFLRQKIRGFSELIAGGIPGVYSIIPTEVKIITGITQVERSVENPNHHYVYTDHRHTRWEGISLADLKKLLNTAGFTVIGTDVNKLYLKVEYDGDNLYSELQSRISEAEKLPEDEKAQELVKSASYYFALTDGTNMDEIMWRDDIDLYRTVSNHSHEVQSILGIDAARIFLIFKFRQTLEEFSSYINNRHISLIFDLLTHLGMINSLSFTGINRQIVGPLKLAAYEKAVDSFMNEAIFGGREAITGVSPAIYVGQLTKRGGTGSVALENDLSVIPQEQIPIPSIDEVSKLDEIQFTPPTLTFNDLFKRDPKLLPQPSHGPVNKAKILEASKIVEFAPPSVVTPTDPVKNLVPSGTQLTMASNTLVSALKKITSGTGLEIEPVEQPQAEDPLETVVDLGDIPNIDDVDLEGLELVSPIMARPAPETIPSGKFEDLKVISTTQVPVPEETTLPGHIEPEQPPVTRVERARPKVERSRVESEVKPKVEDIVAVDYDIIQDPPILPLPPFPTSKTEESTLPTPATTPTIEVPSEIEDISVSIIDALPDLSEIESQQFKPSQVEPISVSNFLSMLSQAPQNQPSSQ